MLKVGSYPGYHHKVTADSVEHRFAHFEGDTPQEYFLASLTAQLSPSRAKARPGGCARTK